MEIWDNKILLGRKKSLKDLFTWKCSGDLFVENIVNHRINLFYHHNN